MGVLQLVPSAGGVNSESPVACGPTAVVQKWFDFYHEIYLVGPLAFRHVSVSDSVHHEPHTRDANTMHQA